MKIRTVVAVVVVFLLVGFQSALAQTVVFSDDFNDGTADGWWLDRSCHQGGCGNWRVENGMLTQDSGGDNYIALVEGIFLANQTIKTDFLANDPGGYGSTVVWYGDFDNWTGIRLIPNHNPGGIWIEEIINGIDFYTFYPYQFSNGVWYQLEVDADASRGLLAVSVDSSYLFTHQVSTLVRAGRSGVADGNAGGFFDNFVLTSNDATAVPEPSGIITILTGLLGLVAIAGIRRFRRT